MIASRLDNLFDRYLRTGGYLYAMAREHEEGRITRDAYRQYRRRSTAKSAAATYGKATFVN